MRIVFLLTAALAAVSCHAATAADERPNVLFIAVDDLRPELGCYGHPVVKSPHIDRLAARGTLFEAAYCQQAVCNPSRASLMTGLRPDTLKVYDLPTNFRKHQPDVITVAQHFKDHGYYTEGIGKIYHLGHGNTDDPPSWSVMRRHPRAPRFGPEGMEVLERQRAEWAAAGRDPGRARGLPWEAPDVPDAELTDGSIAEGAIHILREVKDRPFFLAVGFLNPHLPFAAPKKYWDLYSEDDIRLAPNPYPPQDAPSYATHNFGELRAYYGIPPQGPLSEEQARKMVHGYWAATSYLDACVGRLLDELDRLELRDNTIVILWGDHGWFLGEHGMWCKHANYEEAARAPLIISVPGQQPGKSPALVEFVDIYPTLAELCGLPIHEWLEGASFRPLIGNPNLPWKKAAFHLYPRGIPGQGAGMGRAIRTKRYRLVEWTVRGKDFTEFAEYELYDLETDPGENVNLAGRPAHAGLVEQLRDQLHAGWRAALPPEASLSR